MSADFQTLNGLLSSPLVTPATRQAVEARLACSPEFTPALFTPAEFALLQAVSVQLVPHDPAALPLARRIDARLAEGESDGWRYDALPPDADAYRQLLTALPADFLTLGQMGQIAALTQTQQAHPLIFEELLAELTESYYSRPEAQLGIGYVGFADAAGWTQIGLDQLDPNEALALRLSGQDQR